MQLPPRVSESARQRLAEINRGCPAPKVLRVAVLGGGCSGFQYEIGLEAGPSEGDLVLGTDPARVCIDEMSLSFLAGAVIDHETELAGSRFRIDNPNAVASCGCGSSFSI